MDKRALSERDICKNFIVPAIRSAGWDEMLLVREEFYSTEAGSSCAAGWLRLANEMVACVKTLTRFQNPPH
jgi:hypothetical protein